MTARLPGPPTPASVEAYAFQFDDLFASRAQRCTFRDHLVGLLLPRDRNTLPGRSETGRGRAAPGGPAAAWFLSESP
ncbi:hypothetical protein FDG2_5520 [Candidatus Protofrankia californiensis]|uniref:Uncharacterized protein n=1 Tax=Candidatus Protofrankia californiensis TaxID=1839754 RepID=A0A1C3PE45_9ACTN|nr:hypothetical protein [Protofrankia symbiont of Coriaria ruscifolia]SBW28060.1 hypothetical protein FDG2_5520 [Candidatus Protofrankia californiensis]